MRKRGLGFWDVIIYLAAIVIIIWGILKATDIIQSPEWVNMIPVISGGAAVIGGAYKLGKIMRGIEVTNYKVNKILKIDDDFKEVERNQQLCMNGKLNGSPYKRK